MISPPGGWLVRQVAGPVAAGHRRDPVGSAGRQLWVHEIEAPALVLGSGQPEQIVDRDACAAAGVAVVRRRSGGGAVLLDPGEVAWLDLIIGATDPLWDDDLGRSFRWVGEAWVQALGELGAEVVVHDGPVDRDRLVAIACFAGLGHGEVVLTGGDPPRKLVGLSQRRTRRWARFQCALPLRWRPERLVGLLALDEATRGQLAERLTERAAGLADGVTSAAVVAALVRHLPA